jgi:hypothetical protein
MAAVVQTPAMATIVDDINPLDDNAGSTDIRTIIDEPDPTTARIWSGADWRAHYSLKFMELRLDNYKDLGILDPSLITITVGMCKNPVDDCSVMYLGVDPLSEDLAAARNSTDFIIWQSSCEQCPSLTTDGSIGDPGALGSACANLAACEKKVKEACKNAGHGDLDPTDVEITAHEVGPAKTCSGKCGDGSGAIAIIECPNGIRVITWVTQPR